MGGREAIAHESEMVKKIKLDEMSDQGHVFKS